MKGAQPCFQHLRPSTVPPALGANPTARALIKDIFNLISYSPSMTTPPSAPSTLSRNGFEISSLPSTGESEVNSVPRATRRPSGREERVPSSSGKGSLVSFVLKCAVPMKGKGRWGEWVVRNEPRSISFTSSRTRFMSWSYPFSVPWTVYMPPRQYSSSNAIFNRIRSWKHSSIPCMRDMDSCPRACAVWVKKEIVVSYLPSRR